MGNSLLCKNCGAENEEGMNFCTNCGSTFGEVAQSNGTTMQQSLSNAARTTGFSKYKKPVIFGVIALVLVVGGFVVVNFLRSGSSLYGRWIMTGVYIDDEFVPVDFYPNFITFYEFQSDGNVIGDFWCAGCGRQSNDVLGFADWMSMRGTFNRDSRYLVLTFDGIITVYAQIRRQGANQLQLVSDDNSAETIVLRRATDSDFRRRSGAECFLILTPAIPPDNWSW